MTVRMGIIGVGTMGDLFARIYRDLPTAELVALSDIDADKVSKLAKELGVKAYTDYKEMLKAEKLDAVTICTPDPFHLEPALTAAKAGKHILLEKPIALSIADGRAIIEAAKSADVKLMIGHSLRFDPRYVQAYEIIRRGEIGEIIHIRSWRENSIVNGERLGGRTSVAFFLGVHDIDVLHWYTGSKVRRVYAEGVRKKLSHLNIDDAIFSVLKFEDGSIASLETSWVLPKTQTQVRSNVMDKGMEVVGTKGMLSIQGHNIGLIVQTEKEIFYPDTIWATRVQGVMVGAYKEELAHFLRCVMDDIEPATTGNAALEAVAVALAIEESLKTGKSIEVERL